MKAKNLEVFPSYFINGSNDKISANIGFIEINNKIYVQAIKDILPFEELLAWYGHF